MVPSGQTTKKLAEPIVQDFDWWSYRPVTKPAVPEIQDSWIRNPIDAFVLRKQIENGLSHAAEADRRTLIRRLTFDLWGLPPTPKQVQEFVNDPNPNAYEQLVDRLLDSEHYGERWARHWLDVVKYADTCGYDKDKLRNNAWPYRDYVIRSFNADKPFSRFIKEQIAGDVIYPGTEDGILGLGFIAAGPWDFIGHVEVSESKIDGKVARNLDRDEMVSNTINTFCSLTVQCARCHHHKFDPISQQDYYGLQAIFAAVDRAERRYDTDPHIETKRQKLETEIAELTNQSKTLEQEIEKEGGEELKKLNKTIAELKPKLKVKKSPEFGYHSQIASDPITEKWVQVELPKKSRLAKIVLRPCHDDYANIGAGFGFPIRFKVDVSESQNGADDWSNVRDETKTDFINPGLAPVTIPCNQEVRRIRITATRLAIRSGDYIFALAELQAIDSEGNDVAVGAKVTSLDSIEAPVRWRRSNLTDGKFAVSADLAAQKQFADAHQQRDRLLASIETDERIDKRNQLSAALKKARQELNALPTGKMVYAAATHFKPQGNFQPTKGKPREVRVLHRGEVTKPKEIAQPGVLAFAAHQNPRLPGENEAEKRKALALWLTDKSHPLVWRSIVNRVWQYHFGIGIVATPNDFGRMGATPTHPELLNWLATWFRDGDQSLKQLHRLIVTSSTYRQASNFHRNNAETDRGNQFLWRMNRRRLEAEEIRDSILSVSGALDIKNVRTGLPPVRVRKDGAFASLRISQVRPKRRVDSSAQHLSVHCSFAARSLDDGFRLCGLVAKHSATQ